MAIVVADCPRCRAKNMTLDVRASVVVKIEHGWLPSAEAFCVCRNCEHATIYILRVSHSEFASSSAGRRPEEYNGSLNPYIDAPDRYVSMRDMAMQSAPDHVPQDVTNAFNQGATCLVAECWGAAAEMFRKSVDLATKPLLP